MAVTTMTDVTNILKEVIEPGINDQIQSMTKTISRIKSTSAGVSGKVGGKYVRFAIRTGRNHGMGARSENEALPTPRTQTYETGQLNLSYQYGGINLTGQVFELAETDPQVFASELQNEITGLKEGLAKDANRQVYGTTIGKLATANAVGTTTTFVCSDAEAIYLEPGMVVDTYTSADALKNSGSVITNLTSAGGTTTVTFSPAATATASGDYMVRDDARAREIVGFRDIISDTGTLYGINGATVPLWRATVASNSGTLRALSEGLMIRMADDIQKVAGKQPTVIFCSQGVRRSYFNLLSQLRRVTNTVEFTGGFKGLAFTTDNGDIPVVHDVDCTQNRMYFVNEKEIKLYQAGDWSWMNRDGSMWQRILGTSGGAVTYFDAYIAYLYKYWQLGTHRRNAHGMITDLIEG